MMLSKLALNFSKTAYTNGLISASTLVQSPLLISIRQASVYKFKVKGKKLPIADMELMDYQEPSSDPYFILTNEKGDKLYQSEVIPETLNPKWKKFYLPAKMVDNEKSKLKMEIIDEDITEDDEHMGAVYFRFEDLKNEDRKIKLKLKNELNPEESEGRIIIKMKKKEKDD